MLAFLKRVVTAGDVLPAPQAAAWQLLVFFGLPNVVLAAILWAGLAFAGFDASWTVSARALVIGLAPFLLAFGIFLAVGLARNPTWRTNLRAALRRPTSA